MIFDTFTGRTGHFYGIPSITRGHRDAVMDYGTLPQNTGRTASLTTPYFRSEITVRFHNSPRPGNP